MKHYLKFFLFFIGVTCVSHPFGAAAVRNEVSESQALHNTFYQPVAHALFPCDVRTSTPAWVYGVAGLIMRGEVKDSLLIDAFVQESSKSKDLALALDHVYPVKTRKTHYDRKGMFMIDLGLNILGIKSSVDLNYSPSFLDLVLLTNIVRLRAQGHKKIVLGTYWFGVWKGIADPVKKRLDNLNIKISTSSWSFKLAGANMMKKAKPYFNKLTVEDIIKRLKTR